MRLGAYVAELQPGSIGGQGLRTRGRVRAPPPPLRVQPALPLDSFEDTGFVCSGSSPDGRLVEFIELDGHPFWVGTQAHPEFKSRPDRPAPLFREFVGGRARTGRGSQPAPDRSSTAEATDVPTRPTDRLPRSDRRASSRLRGRASSRVAVGTFVGPDGDAVRARRRAPSGRGLGRAAARRRTCRAGAPVPCRARARPARDPGGQARRGRRAAVETTAPRAGGGGRLAGRAAREAGRVLQLGRASATSTRHVFLGTDLERVAHRSAGDRGAAHDRRAGRPRRRPSV